MVVDLARQLVGSEAQPGYESWRMAYCYGNRIEVVQSHRNPGGELALDGVAEVKTDMVLLCFNKPGVEQPLVHRKNNKTWAFACQGKVPEPAKLLAGEPVIDVRSPQGRFFSYLLDGFNPDDPVGSVESRLVRGPEEPRFFLMNAEALTISTGGDVPEAEPGLWYGRSNLTRVISPVRLQSVPDTEWEPVPERTVMSLTRFRYALT